MVKLIIGNVIALIASILMACSGLVKRKNKIIYIQTAQITLATISNIVLGGISGAIINAIGCVRNIAYHKNKLTLKFKIFIMAITIILSLYFNNLGFIGLLPLISTVTYISLMNIKDVVKFKCLVIFTMLMWLIYEFSIGSYTSTIFRITNIIANIVAIIQIKKQRVNADKNNV